MNSSQGMKGCIVILLVSSTRKYSWPFLNQKQNAQSSDAFRSCW
jgi:hypothetical protein